ncbi:MAG: winged helix-turn-helix domain-containing protein [Bryobacteraceae bacterium]
MSLKNRQFEFGSFRLDPANRRLLNGQKPLALAPKAFDTLVHLVENSGRLVSREELMKAIWPDSLVEDANLTVNISLLRKTLGDQEDGQPYIETVPRKGYRFNADVKLVDPAPVRLQETGRAEKKPRLRQHWILAAAVGLVSIGLAIGWFLWRPSPRVPQFRQRRLTSFAPETAVSAAAISPDGKLLTYANANGLFIQQVSGGETNALLTPSPDFLISNLGWFPDSAKVLVDGASPNADAPSLWAVSVLGGSTPRKLGDYPPGVISPDGSRIALVGTTNGRPEIQLMRSDGGELRVAVTGGEAESFGSVSWSSGGRRLIFVRLRWDPQLRRNSGSIDFYDLSGGTTGTVLAGADFSGDAVSLPDGQILYSKILSANPSASGGELMRIDTDLRSGRARGEPFVVARWDAPITGLSASADGKRLVLRDLIVQHSVYIGELKDAGKSVSRTSRKTESGVEQFLPSTAVRAAPFALLLRNSRKTERGAKQFLPRMAERAAPFALLNVRRFTFGLGREDFPRAWTPDSRALFIESNRNGNCGIFRQECDRVSDEPFTLGEDDRFSPRVSPGGEWLLYLERPRNWQEPDPVRLMRMPISGGLPQVELTASQFSEWGLRFECPQRAGMPCVLAQRQGNEVVFRSFRPGKGFEPEEEIARHPYDPKNAANWTITPDGSQLAWIKWDANEARIHRIRLRSGRGLHGESEPDVVIAGWSHLHAISWAPGGKGWLAVAQAPASWTLLYVNPQGQAHILSKAASTFAPDLFPSPDGRQLAFPEQGFGSNVWLLENF